MRYFQLYIRVVVQFEIYLRARFSFEAAFLVTVLGLQARAFPYKTNKRLHAFSARGSL